MSIRTTGAVASTHDSSAAVERRWMSVVFMQGEDADGVLDMIEKNGPKAANPPSVGMGLRRRDAGCRVGQWIRLRRDPPESD